MRFEFPDTAPLMKEPFKCETKDNDYIIYVNLDSPFAKDFFISYNFNKVYELLNQKILC